MEVSRSWRLNFCRVFWALCSRLSESLSLPWDAWVGAGEGISDGRRKGSRKAVCSGRSTTLVRVVGIWSWLIFRHKERNASLSGSCTDSYSMPSFFFGPPLRQQPPPQHLAANWAVDSPVMRWTSAALWAISLVEARLRRGSVRGFVCSISSTSSAESAE